MGRSCLQCMKYLMFVFNLIFWLGGCGILGVGVWLAVTQGNFATLSSSFPSLTVANLFIASGSVIMVVGFIGCLGAMKENRCLLLTFFIVLLIIFVLELIVGTLFLVYKERINSYAKDDLKKGLKFYDKPDNRGLTKAWDLVQVKFQCCGVTNYTDWFGVFNESKVPEACCPAQGPHCSEHAEKWWKMPCYDTVINWLKENVLAVCIFGLCIAVLQILGLIFSLVMYCQLVKGEDNDYFY
ncbi:tetraspanin-4 [Callorhinchus milii]|uniref:Tetraspanin n=1 Tax=Callorhinchus milii TaxID=7868 RepID=V9L641_CALMI|nr:tetraspanin-4 [Callorhinchus milii]|eukprot:gi/632982452/ref/XP_007908144.1/ PREDICTED: tetraspanin-4 [Callorhinchus milii]